MVLVFVCHLGPQRVIGIRVGQERQDGQKHLRNSQGRTPLILEDIQANHAILVDIRMIDARREIDLGGLKGIVSGEVDGEAEDAARERTVGGSHDSTGPFVEIAFIGGTAATSTRGVLGDVA